MKPWCARIERSRPGNNVGLRARLMSWMSLSVRRGRLGNCHQHPSARERQCLHCRRRCSLDGHDDSLQGGIIPYEPFSRYVSAFRTPFLSEPGKLTKLNDDAIATGRDGMEGRICLAIWATVPGERSIWLAVPCTRVVRDWCVRVELRLRNRRDSLPLREEARSSQGCTKSEQRSGGAQPDTEGSHRSEGKGKRRCKRRCAER